MGFRIYLKKEDKDIIIENGIVAKNGIIILFEDVYYKYKDHFRRRNVCDDVASLTLCNGIICDEDMRIHTPFALFHVNRKGLSDNLKNFTINKPAEKFIWYVEQEMISPEFIEFVGFGEDTFGFTL